MFLQKIKLTNFRTFTDFGIDLQPDFTVLIGKNGAGKTAVLDGAALALGSYLAGLDGVGSNALHVDDAHYKMYEQGSVINCERQFPVRVAAEAVLSENKKIVWQRELRGEGGRTTVGGARKIMQYAAEMQRKVRAGNQKVVLPLVAYYSTGRLWTHKANRAKMREKKEMSRFRGYKDCLDAVSNTQLMLDWFSAMTFESLQEGRSLPELSAVENAMAACYRGMDSEISDVKIHYNVKLGELEIRTHDSRRGPRRLPLHLLSDGIQVTLMMAADIAYRMARLNPQLLDQCIQKTNGVVLIDEVDMHLHPAWQKRIVGDLVRIFPSVQFLMTTHAPSVLANISNEHIRILDEDGAYVPKKRSYGRNVNAILQELMDTDVRPKEIHHQIHSFYDLLDKGELAGAKKILDSLTKTLGSEDQDVMQARFALELEEV